MNHEPYITLKIKLSTAEEFRNLCKKLGKKQSVSLQLMLDFFKNNRVSPMEELGPNFTTLENKVKARINALIAIVRDIEKTQTKPTHAMLQLLFNANSMRKKELMLEKEQQQFSQDLLLQQKLITYENTAIELQKKLSERSFDLKSVLEKVVVVKSNFGKIHLRLNLSREEYLLLKSKL